MMIYKLYEKITAGRYGVSKSIPTKKLFIKTLISRVVRKLSGPVRVPIFGSGVRVIFILNVTLCGLDRGVQKSGSQYFQHHFLIQFDNYLLAVSVRSLCDLHFLFERLFSLTSRAEKSIFNPLFRVNPWQLNWLLFPIFLLGDISMGKNCHWELEHFSASKSLTKSGGQAFENKYLN